VESVSEANARQPAIQRPYSTIHNLYAYNLTEIRDGIILKHFKRDE